MKVTTILTSEYYFPGDICLIAMIKLSNAHGWSGANIEITQQKATNDVNTKQWNKNFD